MGMGDWLMATGEIKAMYARNPIPVLVIDKLLRPRWSEVFENNPKIVRTMTIRHQRLLSGGGIRPYIVSKQPDRWIWRPYRPIPGEIFFTPGERAWAEAFRGAILIESTTKQVGHTNKAWIRERWQAVADRFPGEMIQCGPTPNPALARVRHIVTTQFRQACALLSVCRAFVGTEGGLMHAAAAVGVPSVILWSEFIDPSITGYDMHTNIRHARRTCGRRLDCPSCRESMESIQVDEVAEALSELLKQKEPA